MKTKMLKTKILLSGLLVALATVGRAGTNDLTAALQRGLFEEEANHNLPAAIQAYQSVIAQFDKDRKLAATAVFRLGECYRKQGSTNEAAAQYERIVREFADQAPLVELSRQRLPAQAALAAGQPAGTEEQKRLLDEEIKLAEQKLAEQQQGVNVGTLPPEALLDTQRDILELRLTAAALNAGQPAATDEQKRLLDEEIKLVEKQLVAHERRLQNGVGDQNALRTAQRELLELKRRRAALEAGQPVSLAAAPPVATSAELEEVARIQEMVRNSPDLINASEQGGPTPLVKAAARGQLMVVQYLLRSGADVNLKSPPWHEPGSLETLNVPTLVETALCEAAGRGHLAIVQVLLEHGAAVDAPDLLGDTPLHRAAHAGFKSVVEALLAAKADVNARDSRGWTPLHWAAAEGFKSVAEVLLAAKADMNARNRRGDTPLHLAAAAGQTALVELLLAHKAEVNIKNTGPALRHAEEYQETRDATPLIAAIVGNHLAVVKLLLAAKAEVNLEGEAGVVPRRPAESGSPLHFAVAANRPEIVGLLLDHGANPDAQIPAHGEPRAGMTPLRAAVQGGNKEIAQLLLAHKADPNLPDAEGLTPLHWAVVTPNKEMVNLLLANHAEVNRQDQSGRTPLAYAVGHPVDIAAALLDAKADPNHKDSQGQTPLFYAAQGGHKEMVELLLAKGANPNVRDNSGNTPLALAKNAGSGLPGLPGVPVRPGFPGLPGVRQAPGQGLIAELLRKHGAIEELPRTDVIEVRRPSAKFSEVVFTKGTNDYNHFTLFEAIAAHYGFVTARPSIMPGQTYEMSPWRRQGSLAFPDLRSITVHHPTEDGLNSTVIHFDLWDALQRSDPDVGRLAWGDVVEIPEGDHPINAVWQGLPEVMLARLKQRVERQVQLTVKGQTTNLLLSLQTTAPPGFLHSREGLGAGTAPTFLLQPVLYGSGLLRASSDLSRVKVKRRDAATGQVYELVFDCSGERPGPDFWLQNGDAIEVPEKP